MSVASKSCGASDNPCSSLSSVAEYLLAECHDAVLACFALAPCPDAIVAYVTTGDGDGIADSLTVAVREIAPEGAVGGGLAWKVTFLVRLRESGWPVVTTDGSSVILPPVDEQVAATRNLLAHGEALIRRLSTLSRERRLTPRGSRVVGDSIGRLTPLQPSGGVAGWEIPITVKLGG